MVKKYKKTWNHSTRFIGEVLEIAGRIWVFVCYIYFGNYTIYYVARTLEKNIPTNLARRFIRTRFGDCKVFVSLIQRKCYLKLQKMFKHLWFVSFSQNSWCLWSRKRPPVINYQLYEDICAEVFFLYKVANKQELNSINGINVNNNLF